MSDRAAIHRLGLWLTLIAEGMFFLALLGVRLTMSGDPTPARVRMVGSENGSAGVGGEGGPRHRVATSFWQAWQA